MARMTPFQCSHCQATVYFENVACGQCGAWLGFDPALARMQAYRPQAAASPAPGGDAAPGQPPRWQPLDGGDAGRDAGGVAAPVATVPCHNRLVHGNCNWMVDDADQGATLCRSCRLTRTIPDLSVAGHGARWARIEQAKRRLLFGLAHLGLSPQPRRERTTASAPAGEGATGGDDRGLCFDLLADMPDGTPVRTGHDGGVITLNIAEADDAHREALRVRMGEPLRTLLGHLRHEVAHYLQYRWIDTDAQRSARCRAVFGDERQDYAQALDQHYQRGAPQDWDQRHISAYASAHPWEDWAETCAHWLLIVDATQTAAAWRLRIDGPTATGPRATPLGFTDDTQALVLRQWLPVAQFLNAMNRSIGLHDSYPFLMPQPVLDKLTAVSSLLGEARPPH